MTGLLSRLNFLRHPASSSIPQAVTKGQNTMDDYSTKTYGLAGAPVGGQIGGTYQEAAAPKPTFMDPLGQAHSSLNELLSRMEAVTNRLCGAIPEPAQAGEAINKLQSVPSGVFEELSVRGNDMARKLSRAHDLINRIERALP